jgi:hypothetical protein
MSDRAPLPAALDGVVIVRQYQKETSRGVAFAAEIIRDGRTLGTIENDGMGGGTWFHHHTAADRAWWEEACAAFVEQANLIAAADAAEIGFPPLDGPLSETSVAECLADTLFDLTD